MMLLRFSFENFDEVQRAFDPEIVKKAIRTTIPRTMRKARTNVSKEVRKIYNIKAATVKEAVSLRSRRTSEETVSILEYRGGPLPLDRFGTSIRTIATDRGRRRAVSAKIKKAGRRRVVSGAFPLRGDSGPTMQRQGDSRLPIERIFSLSLPQMVNRDVAQVVEREIGKDANIELNRNLTFFQNKAAR